MPGFNAWAPRYSPFGGMLQGVVHHSKRHYQEKSGVYKALELNDIDRPSKRTRVEMPGVRRYRRSSRAPLKSRRNYRRRRSLRRVPRPIPSLWPARQLVKFKATHVGKTTSTGSGLAAIIFKANDLNDPFGSAGAELPLGLDQWAAMYQQYVCVGSTITMHIHNVSSTGSVMAGILLTRESGFLNSASHYMEAPLVRYQMLSPDVDHTVIQHKYKGKKYEKIQNWKEADDFHGTLTTTPGSPNEIRYYHFWFQDTDVGSSETAAMDYAITIEFVCLLFDPVTPARSSL